MIITNAKYLKDDTDENVTVRITLDGSLTDIPMDPANRHYAEILRQVEAGELTIADAD